MINNHRVIGIILARGGSTRIPRKNIKLLAGHPLIGHTILQAQASKYLDRLIVSTDDEEIAEVARSYKAEVPFMRPAELAEKLTPDFPCIEHALHWLEEHEQDRPEIIVHLRPTSPLREAKHIDDAVELLAQHPEVDSVRTVTEPDQSPYKMYKINEEGRLAPLLTVPGMPEAFNMPGQSLPKAYKHVGYVDVAWRKTILEKKKMSGDLMFPLILEKAYSGINVPDDWDYYEYLFQKKAQKGSV
jgi:N-acylneuraminate cytidylyltransferase